MHYREDIDLTLESTAPANPSETVTFTALAFQVREPQIDSEPDTTIDIQVDGISGIVQSYIANANQSNIPIEATLRPFAFDVETATVLEALAIINMQVRHFSVRPATVRLQLGYTNTSNRQFPFTNYTPDSHPGLLG